MTDLPEGAGARGVSGATGAGATGVASGGQATPPPAPIALDGLAYGVDPLDAILVFHAGDGHLFAGWVRAGLGFGAEEAAESLCAAFRASLGVSSKLSPSRGEGRAEAAPLFVTLELGSRTAMIRKVRSHAVGCLFDATMPLGMARLVTTRLSSTLEPELPLSTAMPATAAAGAGVATTNTATPAGSSGAGAAAATGNAKPSLNEPAREPAAAATATAATAATAATTATAATAAPASSRVEDDTPLDRPPQTLDFPSPGEAVVHRPLSVQPAPSRRLTAADVERITRVLAHLDARAPEPHAARLRVALRAGISPIALSHPEALSPNAIALIETAVADILGTDLSELGTAP